MYIELQIMYVHIMANYSTIKNWLLLRVEDTGYVRSFVLLFPIVLHQLCLLHQVGAKKINSKTKCQF